MKPTIVAIDLEGVLIPEIWIEFAQKTGIKELEITTKDVENYSELMEKRLDILFRNDLTLNDIQEVILSLNPLEGAVDFLHWLRKKTQTIILSDTFYEFAMGIMGKLEFPTLFCHSLITDRRGYIQDYTLRLDDHKRKAVQSFKNLNFNTIAIGDSFNDISMLKQADKGILFNAPQKVKQKYPDFPEYTTYEELMSNISPLLK